MGSERLVTMKLNDLCEIIVDCPHSTPKWTDSGYIVLRNQNIRNGALDLSSPSFTDENGYKSRIKRAEPKAGDIVFTREAPMGEVCLIPEGLKCCLGQRQVLLRPKKEVSGEYLFWALQSPFVQHQVSWNEGTGTTVSNIRIPVLKAFEIPRWFQYEPMIALYLSAIRNKITLNRQINQTLEQMAQTLFKSWFVDFDPVIDNALDAGFFEQDLAFSDELLRRVELRKTARESDKFKPLSEDIRQLFPDAFEECLESMLGLGGWVPKGWGISKLSDFGNIICGKTPSKKEKSFYGNDIPFIKIPDMHGNVFITKTSDNLSFEGGKSQIKKLIPEGSICVSSIATVGLVSITTEPAHTNQQINSIVPQHKYFRDYLYFSLLNKNKHFHDLASGGSTTLNMNTTLFSNVLFSQPDKPILELFQRESGRFLERIKYSLCEIGELTQLRDTLLPKLISGELSLSDIKIDISEETLI
ncbi:restriction endonuclease subunit S [Providencia huaxiensis]|uniref:restriction endonuclease subunit S n=1 Tax=Providencia huaxiensis TaxID=2027290 RepID=UPI001EFE665C|nr:restriction endonuclease subunit S [Providencia huaxiensis]MCG9536470.1 restriction endonuclease subunit S [Providencia huaxiensis]